MHEELLTGKEAAAVLKISERQMYRLKGVPSHLIPGTSSRRYLRSELIMWIAPPKSPQIQLDPAILKRVRIKDHTS